MKRDMNNKLMRLLTVMMLMMFSMSTFSTNVQIVYGGFFRGGTITAKQDETKDGKVTVYLTVTPKKGYTISKNDITVVTTYLPPSPDDFNETRADIPKISEPIDLGNDPKNLSAERTYKITVDEDLGIWVQKANFNSGRKAEEGDVEVTYHIINLGRMNSDGTLGSERSEALKFTISDNVLGLPAKYKSPLAKNWKYYRADEVSFNSTTKVCTFNSTPSLTEGTTLTETADIYVTYEMNEDAFSTVGLKDGGIYNIKQGNLYMYQSMYQNVNNLNAYFQTTNDPTGSIYLWKFNIKDPYQVTIQTKSTSYDNYYLAGEENNFNNIRLKSSLAIAQSTKVWTFGLLSGGTAGTYRLVVSDGYVPTANMQTLDEFKHGYLNNADKARYQRYQGSTYKNCDLTFPALKRSYTFHIIDRSQHHAIQHTVTDQEVGKLTAYTDIPDAIRSPYLEGETMAFYSFAGDYSSDKITDENLITEMPLTNNADIYVTYTNNHLSDKFLHLNGASAQNVTIGGQYIYDDSGLKCESSNTNLTTKNRIWYFSGEDPYAVQIKNAKTGNYLGYSTPSTLLVDADPANKNFILLPGSGKGDNSTYEQMELAAATGDANLYRIGYSEGLNISTTATDDAVQVRAYPVEISSQYYLIDRSGKLIVGPLSSTSSELALPDEWVSPLVSQYHYYKTPNQTGDTYAPSEEIFNTLDAEDGNIYVTYEVGTDIDITGGSTYLLKFSGGEEFHQEDGHDGINKEGHTTYGVTSPTKAVYPYNNGDFHLYVYGQEQWDSQLSSGASTRTRWLWKIVSSKGGNPLTGDAIDPYHVIIKSNQNQTVKDKKNNEDYNYPGNTYLRTYKPDGYGSVVTGVAYENKEYNTAYPAKMPTPMVNGEPTEYMILGTSLQDMQLMTFNKVEGERRIVNTFEQYWKNNPTVTALVGVDPAVDNSTLTGMGWHRYKAWAFAAEWGGNPKEKSIKEDNHWFQTINMGDGKFTLEAVDLVPQVILLDQHGWEIMRTPMYTDADFNVVNADGLRKYNSPMVEEYHWYPKATKATGYHKYTISEPSSYSSNSLHVTPHGNLDGYADLEKKYKTDFYVTYTVKSEYANAYTGAATVDAAIPSAYLLKQGNNYAKAVGTTLSTADEPANMEDIPDNMLWNLKPNFDIDREMGYKYAGESGAQTNALSKTATDAANYSEGRNGFDPYNVQIQSKAQPLYYFTANTANSKLDGGAWKGTSSNVSLRNLNTKQTATGYDQTSLSITNATFMVVDDGAGNMRLMPRFDQQKVMQDFTTFEDNDNGTNAQSLYPTRKTLPKEISSSADITEMNGHYLLAENFSFDSDFESLENFTGIIDGQLHTIRGTLTKPLIKTANGAIIRNVILENVRINESGNVGAIASEAKGSTRIYNCGILATGSEVETDNDGYTKITSNSSTVRGTEYTGGLVGLLDDEARVINCFSYADITGGTYVGGIVGYNNVATTSANLKTMVMNCMFYGDITGGTNKAPIYNGLIITNRGDASGVSNFNYFWSGASYVQKRDANQNPDIQTYNCALLAETRYLQRFEFFRHLLNSHRELAAWWATDDYSNKDQMAKWVMEPSQIGSDTPFPILKTPGYYPSVVNIDADNAPTTKERNKGGKLGELTVTIEMGSGGAQFSPPTGAEIKQSVKQSPLTLNITDKDPDHFNFNYYKVQLPYYNDVGTKNYTGNRVVTGWKITSITVNGTSTSTGTGSFSTGGDVTYNEDGSIATMPYNFADRKSTKKDLYSESGRVFNQGDYWDVPEGVTAITIQPYWAKAAFLADANADVIYNQGMDTAYPVPNVGGGVRYTNGTSYDFTDIEGNTFNLPVYTHIAKVGNENGALAALGPTTNNSGKVYDYAVVLIGNAHNIGISSTSSSQPYTIMSVDFDHDNEPDYSYILRFNKRLSVHPVRVDFLNIPGLGMAQKATGGKGTYNFGIMQPRGWFEATNTALFRVTQLEYDVSGRSAAPMILQGGVIEQWVTWAQGSGEANAVDYYHVGDNVWFKEFHIGPHQDRTEATAYSPHPPISVTGGDYDEFYLTGLYNTPTNNYNDNAECYINGGRFGKVAGTGMQGIGGFTMNGNVKTAYSNGNIVWQIDNADIDEFYAGGINAAHIAEGNITTVITNSCVDQFCGGPKFGDMNSDKKVVTNATNCTFRAFFGAGYGGNSYNRRYPKNQNTVKYNINWDTWLQSGGTFEGETFEGYKNEYISKYGGVGSRIDYQFLPMSDNASNCARLFVDYVSFSLATTYDVTSKLTGCTITKSPLGRLDLFEKCLGNFYGGGSLGKVSGPVKSTLTNCTVEGNVFGAGYSASKPSVKVMGNTFQKQPHYNENLGVYLDGELPASEPYEWEHKATVNSTATAIDPDAQKLFTEIDTENSNLGSVNGDVTLTIDGSSDKGSTVSGNVFGGGEASYVTGANHKVTVILAGKTQVLGNVYGGGDKGRVEGSTEVNILKELTTSGSGSGSGGSTGGGSGSGSGN